MCTSCSLIPSLMLSPVLYSKVLSYKWLSVRGKASCCWAFYESLPISRVEDISDVQRDDSAESFCVFVLLCCSDHFHNSVHIVSSFDKDNLEHKNASCGLSNLNSDKFSTSSPALSSRQIDLCKDGLSNVFLGFFNKIRSCLFHGVGNVPSLRHNLYVSHSTSGQMLSTHCIISLGVPSGPIAFFLSHVRHVASISFY